jgi:hypothetical protein
MVFSFVQSIDERSALAVPINAPVLSKMTKLRRFRAIAVLAAGSILLRGTMVDGSNDQFEKLYDLYFPKHSAYADSQYRTYFDRILFGAPLPLSYRKRDQYLYHAFRRDSEALHRFFHDGDRDSVGEFGEFWAQECLLLLLRWDDDCFAKHLAQENRATREAVGGAIDGRISWGWNKHPFPKTRALYSYRSQQMHRQ